ncbi:hypothetical protein FM106_13795 [Brachybacterium faecium]|nr:hypothetical protein FM106_13795 [Brachybacterium faecium]
MFIGFFRHFHHPIQIIMVQLYYNAKKDICQLFKQQTRFF